MPRYHLQFSERTRSYARRGFIVLGGFAIVLVLFRFTFLSIGTREAQHLSFQLGNNIAVLYRAIFSKQALLLSEREWYRKQSEVLAVDVVELEQLDARVRELERLLNYSETVEIPFITVQFLSRSQSKHEALIDKGLNDGLRMGLPVVVEEGHVLGVLTEVRDTTSVMSYLTSPETSISSSLKGRGGVIGIVNGTGGYFVEMDLIPKADAVAPGDVATTAGLDFEIPSDLILGVVEEVIETDSDSFKSARIRPLIDPLYYANAIVLVTP